jgi:hypothetical protein
VTIVTADGTSHDIQHVDKVQWHGWLLFSKGKAAVPLISWRVVTQMGNAF